MLRNEASSSPCIAALLIQEDPSLSLRMTNILSSSNKKRSPKTFQFSGYFILSHYPYG
ncbi:hypothetical protein ACFJIV_20530 [Mucilaginibacter sp. UC70_90]